MFSNIFFFLCSRVRYWYVLVHLSSQTHFASSLLLVAEICSHLNLVIPIISLFHELFSFSSFLFHFSFLFFFSFSSLLSLTGGVLSGLQLISHISTPDLLIFNEKKKFNSPFHFYNFQFSIFIHFPSISLLTHTSLPQLSSTLFILYNNKGLTPFFHIHFIPSSLLSLLSFHIFLLSPYILFVITPVHST